MKKMNSFQNFKNRDEHIRYLLQTIDEIQNSTSWRVSAPVRWVGWLIRRIKNPFIKLQSKNTIANDLDEHIRYHIQMIDEIHNSTSWRVSAPVRWVEWLIRRIKNFFKLVANILMRGGGLKNTLKKALELYRREGISGIRRVIAREMHGHVFLAALDSDVPQNDPGYFFIANSAIKLDGDVLVYLLYSPDGTLSPVQRKQINHYEEAGFQLIVVINTPQWFALNQKLKSEPAFSRSAYVMVRDNIGYDFGGWKQLLSNIGGFKDAKTLSFTNDSVITIDQDKLKKLRSKIKDLNNVWFMTENFELKQHGQSYFFGFHAKHYDLLYKHITLSPYYSKKEDLIFNEELFLSDRFKEAGFKVDYLFNTPYKKTEDLANITISRWKNLIESGFPFLKLKIFEMNLHLLNNQKTKNLIGSWTYFDIQNHLRLRSKSIKSLDFLYGKQLKPSIEDTILYNKDGVLKSQNIDPNVIPSIVLPLDGIDNHKILPKKVIIILHAYYCDLAIEMLGNICELEISLIAQHFNYLEIDLVITTDDEEKKDFLKAWLENSKLASSLLDVVVVPNRGRNVAPFLFACKKYVRDHDVILHLHTKKSPHDINLCDWGDYLTNSLIGSMANVKSILAMFDASDLGLVFAGHHKAVFDLRNWGFDFDKAHEILLKLDINLSIDNALDFPTGMMFWVRPDAIKPLLDLEIPQNSFDPEDGQIDGTLGHSIERIMNHIVESQEYKTQSVIAVENLDEYKGEQVRLSVSNCMSFLKNLKPKLRNIKKSKSIYNNVVQEIFDVSMARSSEERQRLNIILPSVEPYQIYGGVATAIQEGIRLWQSMDASTTDLRFLITLDDTTTAGLNELSKRIKNTIIKVNPTSDVEGVSLASVYANKYVPLSIRKNDILFATAWWTADLGFRIRSAQLEYFDVAPQLVYLVQDYEPIFYNHSNKYVLAKNTYLNPEDTIFIFNSEELTNFFISKHTVSKGYHLKYKLNQQLEKSISALRKKKIILVYGRPSVDRNAFSIILEGLRRWQSHYPQHTKDWEILFVGENFTSSLIGELVSSQVMGKVTLKEYAKLLSESTIGISIMLSPHPSYPPLEMSSAGIKTITNSFDFKDMTKRSDFISSLDQVSPDSIAAKISMLTNDFRPNRDKHLYPINSISCQLPQVDYNSIVKILYLKQTS